MPELDFSKIFGETAISKASFTDENYLNGWGHLGSTPPPYQLFDYLQSLNDKKSKYLYDNINENKNNLLAHNTDSSAHTAILNAIKAITGMGEYDIAPSKTIDAIIQLLGFGGIVAQRLENNGYVKFANGFIIQWGEVSFPQGARYLDVNLPIACNLFIVSPADVLYGSATSINYDSSLCWNVGASSNTKIRILTTNDYAGSVLYITLGISV